MGPGSRYDRRSRPDRFDHGPGRRTADFDFFVLALSWSPGFCRTNEGAERRDQCRRGAGIGFTVHGLWPQYTHGFPTYCHANAAPSRATLATTEGLFPDAGLARSEWRKHGTCSGLGPIEYFAAVQKARDAVTIPPRFTGPRDDQQLSPAEVVRSFTASNPSLRPGMLAVECRDGTLDEVRICLDRTLSRFQPCPEVVRHACRAANLDVPAVR